MDGDLIYEMIEIARKIFWVMVIIFAGLVIAVPLAIWKIVDLVWSLS